MESDSIFSKIKPYLGLIVAGLVVGFAVHSTYFVQDPAEELEESPTEVVAIPDNKNTLYPDETALPDPLPEEVMPQHPTLYKSRGQITANIVSRQRSPYGDVVVFDYHNSTRCFLVEGVNESCWNFRTSSPSNYTRQESLLLQHLAEEREVKDVLVVGVGAGTLLKDLDGSGLKIDGVDINPVMPKMAEEFFILPKDLDFEYIIDDGRHFLNTTDKKYDAIVFDLCYVNEANAHLWTKEFYALAKSKLKDPENGFLITSRGVVVNEENEKLDAIIASAMSESFTQLYHVDNLSSAGEGQFAMGVYLATDRSVDVDKIQDTKILPWEFDASHPSTSDAMLDEMVDLFLPAAEKIREQTRRNWGDDIFLPL